MSPEERARRFIGTLPRASDRTDLMLHYVARMSGQSDIDRLTDEFTTAIDEALGELEEWAQELERGRRRLREFTPIVVDELRRRRNAIKERG